MAWPGRKKNARTEFGWSCSKPQAAAIRFNALPGASPARRDWNHSLVRIGRREQFRQFAHASEQQKRSLTGDMDFSPSRPWKMRGLRPPQGADLYRPRGCGRIYEVIRCYRELQ